MKAAERRIALNTILLSSTELLTKLVSFLLVVLVARRLGPYMMGIYAFALTFINLFEILINFGLDRYIQREVARDPDLTGQLYRDVFVLKLLVFLVSSVIILALGLTVVDTDLKRSVVWILSLSLFFRANIASSNAFFRAHQKAQYEALVVATFRLVYGGGGLAAILSGQGLIALASLELAAQAGACFLSFWLFVTRIATPLYGVRLKQLLDLLWSAKDFLFIRIVLAVFASINMLMLSLMAGDTVAGYYSAALRLSSAFDFLPVAFTGAFLPVLSQQTTQGWNGFSEIFRYNFKYSLLIGLGLAAILGGMAENCITVVFGHVFSPAIMTLSILGLTLPVDFASHSLSNALIALDQEKKLIKIYSLTVLLNIILNLLLIPAYQQNGAAGAMLLSEIMMLALQLLALGWGRLKNLGLLGISARPILAGFLGFFLGRALVSWELNLLVGFILMPLGLLILMIFTGALSRSEILAAVSLIPSRKRGLDSA